MAADVSTIERLRARLKMRLVDVLDGSRNGEAALSRPILEDQLRQVVKAFADENRSFQLPPEEQTRLIHDTLTDMVGFGPLDALLDDPTISEIMVNGPSEIFVERSGRLERTPLTFRDAEQLRAVIERLLGSAHQTVNESSPLCDATLPGGARLNVVIPPLALNGPVITIRRALQEWTIQDYIRMDVLSPQAAEFLEGCVKAKVNFIVSGGTSTGKTTLVSILSAFIPACERLITIENIAELQLPGQRHWVRLVAKPPNVENRGEIPLRVLVSNALRMRPDRIILGEARGGEALDVVQAMHSGHEGFITVLHAGSPHAALERLETLMLMSGIDVPPSVCRMQIATAVDLVVHMGRFVDGSRRVAAISQVLGGGPAGYELEDVFRFHVEGFSVENQLRGACRYTGARPKCLAKFQLSNVPVPTWVTA